MSRLRTEKKTQNNSETQKLTKLRKLEEKNSFAGES
jgi:hypothetical protein